MAVLRGGIEYGREDYVRSRRSALKNFLDEACRKCKGKRGGRAEKALAQLEILKKRRVARRVVTQAPELETHLRPEGTPSAAAEVDPLTMTGHVSRVRRHIPAWPFGDPAHAPWTDR